ncbi:hypothetical protein fugu_015344 [Takifugu bimaculatus]|uniref:non-specific serine/threonine protein kinase n=2 Tax=Takifugu bimaculatus TaxID=433685 RepID=A0A4Z2BZL1_9TELE|nr:hypothetical protein fugu_015344 [Takifugu bimaculatus]
MRFDLHVIVMSSAFFNPSFAFSSHFDTDGAPLSELSWPSSLAVVAVSFSGLFTFIFLMLACLCCKKGDIGFKEFDNAEGEEYQADLSALASPASQNGPEVYVLPLTEVSLPVSKQPGRSIQLLKSSDLGRHSLLYLKEIGHGWFGKVLLGEVSAGLSTTQVVVKELKASSSVQDQMQFMEEVQPYRTLQHPALLQCLAQCSEVTPYLLVMEFCPLGDVKSYLHSYRQSDPEPPDPLLLQRLACDIASGLLHLHKNNFVHSDLALRNCLLTSDMSVKIGDYGLSHSRFKEDYYVTQDQIWVPLRWIAPELIDEVHGNLLVVDQTKSSNIWSLGDSVGAVGAGRAAVQTLLSDRQVLTYAVKEQQLKLPKPHLHFSMDERWYEVMQFCWLQPDLRPCSEEVHLLVTYLCAKGSSEVEEEFELRWNALKPNLLGSPSHAAAPAALVLTPTLASASSPGAEQPQAAELASSASSSFPLLEHFSDSFHSDTGDDLLTVTETSHGLNFEYKWEQARAEQPYCSSSTFGPLGQGNPHYQDIYYSSIGNISDGCRSESLSADVSPRYYEPEQPGVVPVLSAHSPSVSSEYYIRIEEQTERNINSLDENIVDYSPGLEAQSSGLSSDTRLSTTQQNSHWTTADNSRSAAHDSGPSPSVHVTIEPFLKPASDAGPVTLDETHKFFSSSQDDVITEQTAVEQTQRQICLPGLATSPESRSHHVHLDIARHQSQPVSSPSLGFCDPYLEASAVTESCFDASTGPSKKTLPVLSHISVDVERDSGLLVGRQRDEDIENDFFVESESSNWTSNHSANNNSLAFDSRHTTESWSLTKDPARTFQSSKSTLEAQGDLDSIDTNRPNDLGTFIPQVKQSSTDLLSSSGFPVSGKEGGEKEGKGEQDGERSSALKTLPKVHCMRSPSGLKPCQPGQTAALTAKQRGNVWDGVSTGISVHLGSAWLNCPEGSEKSRALGSGAGAGSCSFSLAELGDYSEDEDDVTDITAGLFADFNLDYAEVEEEELSPTRNPERRLDSVETFNLSSSIPSTSDPSDQAFSPDPYSNAVLPKSLDSGYDTENNESPEFIFKELADPRGGERSPRMGGDLGLVLQVGLGQALCTSTSTSEPQIKSLADETLYRDSDYYSDYDAEYERSPREEGGIFCGGSKNDNFDAAKSRSAGNNESVEKLLKHGAHLPTLSQLKRVGLNISEPDTSPSSPHPAPGFSMLSPFPPQMGGCLTKESGPADENLGLDTEHSAEEPSSELTSSIGSEASSTVQEAPGGHEEGNRRPEDCSHAQSLHLDSTMNTFGDEASKENEKADRTREDEEVPDLNDVKEEGDDGSEAVRINEEDFEDIDAEECNSQDSLGEEPNGPLELSSSSSFMELCGEQVRAPLEEAEDEYDSEDSDSDEELRTYNIQDEDSEESEDDLSVVPVVVSDCSRSSHLRSLLKMPALLTQSFCDELERKKKAVSFFDDVTVFLFDQESPTGELVDYSFSTATDSDGQEAEPDGKTPQLDPESDVDAESCESFCSPDEAQENHQGDDSGGCRDLTPKPHPSSAGTITECQTPPAPTSNTLGTSEPAAASLNRFMGSRFSITHVSDPHRDLATGNSGDSPSA